LLFFKGKPKEVEEFLIQIIETLGIIIDRRLKKRLKKKDNK